MTYLIEQTHKKCNLMRLPKYSKDKIINWCYLCRKCGEYHPISTKCIRTVRGMHGANITIQRLRKENEAQSRELKQLLAMKRYIENHQQWKDYYATQS